MNKTFLITFILCFTIILQGQVSKTTNVTAGNLKTLLTTTELTTVTNLTLTGTLDARDFKTMRDDMTVLVVLDLSSINIASYSGTEGTLYPSLNDYPANTIPDYFLYPNNFSLTSVIIPSSVTSIGSMAFYNCTGLKNLTIPSSVLTIDNNAFANCTALNMISIPSSVTNISDGAFLNCGGSINVDPENQKYSSIDGILFNKQQTKLIQCPSSKTGNYVIPSSVKSIGNNAFNYCTGLTSISLPYSVNTIEYYAFGNCSGITSIMIPSSVTSLEGYIFDNCSGLTSLFVQNEEPLDLSNITGVFEGLNKTTCKLYVPFGSSALYYAASQWQDFTNILEMPEFKLSANSARIISTGGLAKIDLTTGLTWTAVSDKTWLTVNPSSGNGTHTLFLTAQANPTVGVRIAEVKVSATELPSQFIIVTQEGLPKTLNITAGSLSSTLTPEELSNVYSLVLTGTIDARDFKTMSYYMPGLQIADLSGATIKAYSGTEGTDTGFWDYPANAIPDYAFSRGLMGNETLRSILLPSKVTSVGYGAFYNCTTLSSITLPSTVTQIIMAAFGNCSSLSAIDLPSSLVYIGEGAFMGCNALTSITIPESVTTIDRIAFSGCTGLTSINIPSSAISVDGDIFQGIINVDEGNPVYSSIDGIMFDKLKTTLIHYPSTRTGDYTIPSSVITIDENAFFDCAGLTSVTIPLTVTSIKYYAFYACTSLKTLTLPESVEFIGPSAFAGCFGLTSVTIPASVTTILSSAFYNCTNLTTIYNQRPVPQNIHDQQDVFGEIDKSICKLYVPFGSSQLYASASQWQDFANIIEMAEFKLSATTISISATGGIANVDLLTGLSWTAISDKTWLSVNPPSGTGSHSITFTVEPNTFIIPRMATVTVSVPGIPPQTILITQAMSSDKVNVSAGGLSNALTAEELKSAKKLVLTGTIDARDFKTMRDKVPLLAEVDLSGVTIVAYTGDEGTYNITFSYAANRIPVFAFCNPGTLKGKTGLTTVVLPSSVNVVDTYSFSGCTGLTSINIPSSVVAIGQRTFYGCISLNSIDIPSSVELIGDFAFLYCYGLFTVDTNNQYFSSNDGILYNKQQTILIQCPTSKTGFLNIPQQVTSIGNGAFSNSEIYGISMPPSLTSIGDYAFAYCFNLYVESIPSSVISIGNYAFYGCNKLRSINSYRENPIDLSASQMVFEGIDKSSCQLIVPFGSSGLYKTANQWKDFINIVEMPGLALSTTTANIAAAEGSKATLVLTSNTTWTASSDKTWLTVNPASGIGNSTLTFTAEANPLVITRIAIVTVFGTEVGSHTITVTQDGGVLTGINKTENSSIEIYPNPASNYIIINTGDYSELPDYSIRIVNQLGKIIFKTKVTQPRYEINISSWSGKGFYVLQVYDSNNIIKAVKKIILQ